MGYGKPEITHDRIKCEECQAWQKKITSQHVKKHGLTIPQYKEKWGFNDNQPLEAGYITELRRYYNKLYDASKNIINHPNNKPFQKGVNNRKDKPVREQERIKLASMAINVQSTPEFKQKISEASKKMWQDPAYREKSIASYKKKYSTPEMRAEMSKRSKQGWNNPEQREKASEQRKAIWNTPEKKAYASERSKKNWAKKKARQIPIDFMEAGVLVKRKLETGKFEYFK